MNDVRDKQNTERHSHTRRAAVYLSLRLYLFPVVLLKDWKCSDTSSDSLCSCFEEESSTQGDFIFSLFVGGRKKPVALRDRVLLVLCEILEAMDSDTMLVSPTDSSSPANPPLRTDSCRKNGVSWALSEIDIDQYFRKSMTTLWAAGQATSFTS